VPEKKCSKEELLKCRTSGTVAKFNQSNSNSYFLNKTPLEKISSGASGHQILTRLSIWIELVLPFNLFSVILTQHCRLLR